MQILSFLLIFCMCIVQAARWLPFLLGVNVWTMFLISRKEKEGDYRLFVFFICTGNLHSLCIVSLGVYYYFGLPRFTSGSVHLQFLQYICSTWQRSLFLYSSTFSYHTFSVIISTLDWSVTISSGKSTSSEKKNKNKKTSDFFQ